MNLNDLISGYNAEEDGDLGEFIQNKAKENNIKILLDDGKANTYIPKKRFDSVNSKNKANKTKMEELQKQLNELLSEESNNSNNSSGYSETNQRNSEIEQLKKELNEMKAFQKQVQLKDELEKELKVMNCKMKAEQVMKLANFENLNEEKTLSSVLEEFKNNNAYAFGEYEEGSNDTNNQGGTGDIGNISKDITFGNKTYKTGDFGKLLAKNAMSNNQTESNYFK